MKNSRSTGVKKKQLIKVLHLWVSDSPSSGGGGAGSMFRLHNNLRKAGIESRILCEYKKSFSRYVSVKPGITKAERWIKKFTSRFGLNDIHRISSFSLNRHESYKAADIVHFHGIHSGFISYLALPSLTENKAAVFTLRDMWCLTGHCVYSYDCERWKSGCGKCPYPNVYPRIRRDGTRIEWWLKNRAYSRSNLIFVSPSTWLENLAKESMINRFPIKHIPNGVDTDIYHPLDPEQCRSVLGIPGGKHVLMFAAVNLSNHRKGADLLITALQSLPQSLKAETVLIVLGNSGDTIAQTAGMQTFDLGYVTSARLKTIAYSAADLFIFPTRADNLPLVLLESLACGTPIVSFQVGGVPDLVRPGITGNLAEPENTTDLCKGIIQLVEDKALRRRMSEQCRSIALKEYSSDLEAKRYTELYQQILEQ
jgi:glycosyltransferase involved in cell wall biosynthesis